MVFKRRAKRATRPRRKAPVKTSPLFRKKVEKIIHAAAEDKYQRISSGNTLQPMPMALWAGAGGACIPVLNYGYTLFPDITQGPGSFQRLGNKIRVKNLIVNWQISLKPDLGAPVNIESLPLLVRLLVLKSKAVQSPPQLASTISLGTDLFNYGGGLYGGGTNRPSDMELRVNRKLYTVVSDKVMKLEKGQGADQTSTQPTGSIVCVSPTSVHRFQTRIPCGMNVNYSSESAIFPDNFAPFFTMCWTQANSDCPTPPNPAYLDRVLVHFDVHMDFEDN